MIVILHAPAISRRPAIAIAIAIRHSPFAIRHSPFAIRRSHHG
jgi:hypothetical protein